MCELRYDGDKHQEGIVHIAKNDFQVSSASLDDKSNLLVARYESNRFGFYLVLAFEFAP
jgi:hypothetical protein